MENNLQKLTKEISSTLFDSMTMLEILNEIHFMDTKEGLILSILKNNILNSFNNVEKCRELISTVE